MKKIRILSFLFLILTPLLWGNSYGLTREEASNKLKEFIKTDFNILEIREAPFEGFWEIVTEVGKEKTVVYLHNNLRFIIVGRILDLQVKKDLTLERWKEFRRVEVSSLPLENAITMGEGKRKLYVFTDPECHFCFQLHEALKQTKDIQTFFFLYPLNPNSYKKATSIWCSQDRIKTLEEAYQGKELPFLPCDTKPVDKNIELGKRLTLQSTPTLIFPNGKIVEGYTGSENLESLLESNSGL
jgi:thiol:disulfide interchange protein DsbC